MCIKRCILGISFAHKAKLERILAGYLVKTSIKGGRRHVTDLINRIVQVLKGDLYWFKISARDMGLIKPVKP